jgi:hypothetical protein
VHAVVAALVEEVEVLVGEELRSSEGGVRTHALSRKCVRLSLQKKSANKRRDVCAKRKIAVEPSVFDFPLCT